MDINKTQLQVLNESTNVKISVISPIQVDFKNNDKTILVEIQYENIKYTTNIDKSTLDRGRYASHRVQILSNHIMEFIEKIISEKLILDLDKKMFTLSEK